MENPEPDFVSFSIVILKQTNIRVIIPDHIAIEDCSFINLPLINLKNITNFRYVSTLRLSTFENAIL